MARRPEPDDEDEVAREIRAHLDLEAEERVADGLSETEARYAARRAFGNVARTQEDVRAVWTRRWMDEGVRDVRVALRAIRRAPGAAAVIVLTLALGIGSTTVVFSVVDAVLLRVLPGVSDPAELVLIEQDPQVGMTFGLAGDPWPFLELLRARHEVIANAFVWMGPQDLWMHLLEQPRESGALVAVQFVSGTFFQTLGVDLVLGRGFSEEDERADGPGAAVIGHDLWRRQFATATDVIGRSLVVDGETLAIVGVAPPAFRGPDAGVRPDLWQLRPVFRNGGTMVARLRAGASQNEARAVAAVVSAQAGEISARRPLLVSEGARGWHSARAQLTRPLAILGAAGTLVLLIACVNVAGLLLASGWTRRHELLVRRALGAPRHRLIRQLLTESSVLAMAGTVLGVLVAVWSTRLLASSRLLSAHVPGLALDIGVDLRVLAFALAACLLTIAIVGLVPAIAITRAGPDATTSDAPRQGRVPWRPVRPGRLLVAAQVALAFMLLAGAGLLLGTLVNLYRVDPGFRADNTIFLQVERAAWARGLRIDAALNATLTERLQALPGIESVARTSAGGMLLAPSEGSGGTGMLITADASAVGDIARMTATGTRCFYTYVSAGFFRTMGIRIVEGRDFRAEETEAFAAAPITRGTVAPVVISRSLADRFFGPESAVGRRIYTVPPGDVVGVVDEAKHHSLRQGEHCAVYLPFPGRSTPWFVLAADGDPVALKTALARTVRDVDASLEPLDLRTFAEVVDDSLVRERLVSRLLVVYAAIALIMAAIGIYGAVSYSVSQRTREIGVRMALGAQARTIASIFARETGVMVGAGLIVGCVVAILASRVLASLLFGVTPADPLTLALAVLTLLAVAALACWRPAHRATRVDPAMSLRAE